MQVMMELLRVKQLRASLQIQSYNPPEVRHCMLARLPGKGMQPLWLTKPGIYQLHMHLSMHFC